MSTPLCIPFTITDIDKCLYYNLYQFLQRIVNILSVWTDNKMCK